LLEGFPLGMVLGLEEGDCVFTFTGISISWQKHF
jgi:hypothetical protein